MTLLTSDFLREEIQGAGNYRTEDWGLSLPRSLRDYRADGIRANDEVNNQSLAFVGHSFLVQLNCYIFFIEFLQHERKMHSSLQKSHLMYLFLQLLL